MVIFWAENKLTLLYKLHTDYFSLCQSVIWSVLSHEEIYLNICRNVRDVLTFVIHCVCVYIYIYIYIYIYSYIHTYSSIFIYFTNVWNSLFSPSYERELEVDMPLNKETKLNQVFSFVILYLPFNNFFYYRNCIKNWY